MKASVINNKNVRTKSSLGLNNKDKSILQAGLFCLISEIVLSYFMASGNLKDSLITIGVFILILFMDSRTEKVKHEHEKERAEAEIRASAEKVIERNETDRRERSRENNRRTMDAVYHINSRKDMFDIA